MNRTQPFPDPSLNVTTPAARTATANIKSRKRGLILLAVVTAFVAFVFYSLTGVEPVKVTGGHLERQGGRVMVRGVLHNTGPDLKTLGVEVTYYDSRGHKLAQDRLEVANLRHDADVPFQAPERELPEASDFSIQLDRGRNPYGN